MAASIVYKTKDSLLDKCGAGFKKVVGSLTLTGTYSTDGEAMDISAKFPNELQIVTFEIRGGILFEYDYTAKKVKAFYFDYNGGADGVAIEVANGGDITGATGVRFVAIGF